MCLCVSTGETNSVYPPQCVVVVVVEELERPRGRFSLWLWKLHWCVKLHPPLSSGAPVIKRHCTACACAWGACSRFPEEKWSCPLCVSFCLLWPSPAALPASVWAQLSILAAGGYHLIHSLPEEEGANPPGKPLQLPGLHAHTHTHKSTCTFTCIHTQTLSI